MIICGKLELTEEGSSCCLPKAPILEFAWKDWKKPRKILDSNQDPPKYTCRSIADETNLLFKKL
jgi:hypothetical protein